MGYRTPPRTLDERSAENLLALLRWEDRILPVRPMEAAIRRGSEALDLLVPYVGEGPEKTFENPVWPVVLLGELARGVEDPGPAARALAVPLGEHGLRNPGEPGFWVALAASEALAKIGEPAVPVLGDLLSTDDERVRLPAYASLGVIGTDRAVERLLQAAEEDIELADVLAYALEETGRKEAVAPLYRLLGRCPACYRSNVQAAIRNLHHGALSPPLALADWRFRYRPWGGFGSFDPGWVGLRALIRDPVREAFGRRPGPPVRHLEEILAEGPERGPELEPKCIRCGHPGRVRYGLASCGESHAGCIAALQLRLLVPWAEEGATDLFQVLGDADHDVAWITEEFRARNPDPRTRLDEPASEKHEGDGVLDSWWMEATVVGHTCQWFLERGVEDLPAALEELDHQARRTGPHRPRDRTGGGKARKPPKAPKDAYYERWIRERTSELGGLSPWVASELVVGRRAVENILLEYEEAEREAAKVGSGYDLTWVWEKLVLARPEASTEA